MSSTMIEYTALDYPALDSQPIEEQVFSYPEGPSSTTSIDEIFSVDLLTPEQFQNILEDVYREFDGERRHSHTVEELLTPETVNGMIDPEFSPMEEDTEEITPYDWDLCAQSLEEE